MPPRATRGRTLALALLAGVLAAGCGNDPGDGRVRVTPERVDFGRVPHGEVRTRAFTVRNGTGRPILVRSVEANCSCFGVSDTWQPRLDPGAETRFDLRLTSAAVSPQRLRGKHLEVRTDHPDHRTIRIPLEGEIYAPFEMNVEALQLGVLGGGPGDHEPRRVELRPKEGYSIARVEATPARPEWFTAEVVDARPRGKDVLVTLKDEVRGTGALDTYVVLRVHVRGPGGPEAPIDRLVRLKGAWATR